MADGWNPTGLPMEAMAQMFGAIRQMAEAAGRNPTELKMIVRGNLVETPKPVEQDRAIFVGSLEQIREDIAACEKIGAEEVFLELGFTHGGQTAEQLGEAAGGVSAAVSAFSPRRHGDSIADTPEARDDQANAQGRRGFSAAAASSLGRIAAIFLDLAPIPTDDSAVPAWLSRSWMSRRISCDH